MKFIRAVDLGVREGKKTKLFRIEAVEGDTILGLVKWQSGWRRYCFFPEPDTLYESQCLKDLSEFCATETAKRKLERAAERA